MPTRVQAKPLRGGGSSVQCATVWLLPTRTTVLLFGKHQRVSVAGFSSRIVFAPCFTVKVMFGSSQHHHHQGKIARSAGFASLRLINSVREASGANSARWAEANACPRTRSFTSGRGKES